MASEVDICNSALNAIGASNIIALTEDSRSGRLCNQRYTFVRDSVFRAHPWNCLIKRVELAQDSDAPSWEYAYSYQLPADPYCLRVLEVEGEDLGIQYVIEGRKILTDEGTVKIRYIARVTDPTEYDAGLIETLSAALAAELAYPIANSNGLAQNMYSIYQAKLSEARFVDATEGTPDEIIATDFVNARR
jgi:hypothetical protein